ERFDYTQAEQLLKENSTEVLCASHTQDDDEMKELRESTSNYRMEEKQSLLYRIVMTDLLRLEKDIMRHAQIEDEILIKKAKKEERMLQERMNMERRKN